MPFKQPHPIRIEGNVAYVPLTKGYEAVIDAADVALIANRNWTASEKFRRDGTLKTVYAYRMGLRSQGERGPILLHRVILAARPGFEVDHRDGNGLNNRRNNLREATRAQNQRNRRISCTSKSGVKGVSWNRANRCWVAFITLHHRSRYLGSFRDIEDAAAAYAKASRELHGSFGRTA